MTSIPAQISIEALSSALGADVKGVDLSRPLNAPTLRAVKDAWAKHLVLRFRAQRLSDPQLEAFSAQLGPLDDVPPLTAEVRSHVQSNYVTVISNVLEQGKPIGELGNSEAVWHTDMSYVEVPPMASALYALEVPDTGGDTGFCNMYTAYETLPKALRERIVGLQCKHDSTRTAAGGLRKGYKAKYRQREAPGALHPLVRVHPITGRKALFLGRRLNADIPSLALEESEALLDALWAHAARPEFAWHQKWQVGDLVLWDNRCVMHRRDAFDASRRRLMHRTQIAGEPVIPANPPPQPAISR